MSLLALFAVLSAAPQPFTTPEKTPSPTEIVAAASTADWREIAPSQLLVMDLAPDSARRPRLVVIQLLPEPFSQGWIDNIRKLATAHWWDRTSINRAQDNYVVQWGDPEAENKAKAKPLPPGLATVPQEDYVVTGFYGHESGTADTIGFLVEKQTSQDPYAATGMFREGFPIAGADGNAWPVHCYGSVGVGRDMPPDTGTGAELYVVIGHAPRQLDRNIAVVGRVIEGIEHLSTLPRGTGDLGFYRAASERTQIRSIRLGSEVANMPVYEYLGTETEQFARYAEARANRRDAFFIQPAGGADICNVPVPVRRRK